jgi:adenine-specific DNA-methyltransferase
MGREKGEGAASWFTVRLDGREFQPNIRSRRKTNEDGMAKLVAAGRVHVTSNTLAYVRFLDDFRAFQITNTWMDIGGIQSRGDPKIYVVQTATTAVERCLLMTTDPGDLVLDPTCGNGTTAYVAEHWGRRWITIDTSRVALALARTLVMTARYPYFLLADSPEGERKEAEITGTIPVAAVSDRRPAVDRRWTLQDVAPPLRAAHAGLKPGSTTDDIKKGFVYNRVPHITLKSIANNDEIDAIHAKFQQKLEPLRADLNKSLKKSWQEWKIPREADAAWTEKAKKLHAEWWKLRRERQKEIDESIARHADTELLYDQPYEDSKRVRVAGSFTVESLSPHRALSTDDDRPASESEARREPTAGQFETMILENLKKAGVQNTIKNERLTFDRLEPYPGTWLHAAGEYTEKGG